MRATSTTHSILSAQFGHHNTDGPRSRGQRSFRYDDHFCYITIHRWTFNLKAFDHEGRLFDQFSIEKD
jgi:hypothetical protein